MDWTLIGLIALMFAGFYFMLIRPQQKRAKEQKAHMDTLAPGSRVMTISGIVGTIKHLGEKQAIIEISPGVEMTVVKGAISMQPVDDEFEYADDNDVEEEEPDVTDDAPKADQN